MKLITRFATTLALSAAIIVPSIVSAQTSIYTNSNGAFQVNSVSGNGSFFSFGNTGGGGGSFMCGASNICYVASTILYLINNVLVPVLFAVAFIVFLYGIAKAYIFSGGDSEKVSEGHKLLLWGIIAFVVMISIWGLVNVVANTFGLAGAYAPPIPSSISPYSTTP